MVFKRRDPRTWWQTVREAVYPRGGIRRSVAYVLHRMRRLPDPPHRIARGVFAGTFVNFPPVYMVQMLSAAGLAYVMRGNILAALLATFISNPLTTPFIAMGCLKLGHWMLGIERPLTFHELMNAFTEAGGQLLQNFLSFFTDGHAEWDKLGEFFDFIFWPYVVGSMIPGLVAATIAYYLTLPAVHAYQRLRAKKRAESGEKRRALRAVLLEKARAAAEKVVHERKHDNDAAPSDASGGDDRPGTS